MGVLNVKQFGMYYRTNEVSKYVDVVRNQHSNCRRKRYKCE